jgi:uncharacterized protein YecE (DUF72 family)
VTQVRIGISGWRYAGWRGDFYPSGLVQRSELAFASERLSSIEINGSFYALQRPTSYATWRQQTPDDFVFSLKGGRFITHMKRLVDVDTALANFFASGPLALGAKLGPVLWQLPATSRFDADVVAAFCERLPTTTVEAAALAQRHDDKVPTERAMTTALTEQPMRYALEPRHASFGDPAAAALLRRYGVSLVVSDAGEKWPRFDAVTADFMYLRLHGAEELYSSGYTGDALDDWARRISRWTADGLDVFVYFDNDMKVRAPYDALALSQRLGIAGRAWLPTTETVDGSR